MTPELATSLVLTLAYAALLVLAFIYFKQKPKQINSKK
jgi:hypothetical protein